MKAKMIALLSAIGIHGGLNAEQRQDIANATMHAAPGVGAAGVTKVVGIPLSDWLVIASILFVILQAAHLIWKWRREAWRDAERKRLKSLIEPDVKNL